MRRWIGIASHLGLVLFGIVIALGLAELGLRLRPSLEGTGGGLHGLHEPRPDRPWLYGLRPGARADLMISGAVTSYAINADGFRDRLYPRPKPPGTFRILVLGDSVAFGYGVEEAASFPKVLEERLARLAPATQRIEVLNFGVGGYNPYTEEMQFQTIGVSYEPDLVLLQFCINDLNDPTVHFDGQTLLHLGALPDAAFPNPALRRPQPGAPAAAVALCRRSRLCALLDTAWLAHNRTEPDAEAAIAAYAPDFGNPGPQWDWLGARYGAIARQAEALHAPLLVLAFPYRNQVEGRDSGRVEERLVNLGQAGKWTTLNLLPAFQHAAQSGARLFLDVWHPTAAGHRAAAESILRELQCRKLLPFAAEISCE